MTDFTFAALVMDRGQAGDDWRGFVRTSLASEGIAIEGDAEVPDGGELRAGDHLLGWAAFDGLEHGGDRPALAPWIACDERAGLGRPVGLFRWTHPAADHDEKRRLLRAIARGARGVVARRDEDAAREMVTLRSFPVVGMLYEHGFDEGSALVERTRGAYADAVVAAAREILTRAQIDAAFVGFSVDPHAPDSNPLRIRPPLTRAGARIPADAVERTLYALDPLVMPAIATEAIDPADPFWDD